jgi:hypothetical protein
LKYRQIKRSTIPAILENQISGRSHEIPSKENSENGQNIFGGKNALL